MNCLICCEKSRLEEKCGGFLGGRVVKNPPANAGDTRDVGSSPGLGRSPGIGNGNPLQYFCLEKLTHRESQWVTVYGAHKESDRTELTEHSY